MHDLHAYLDAKYEVRKLVDNSLNAILEREREREKINLAGNVIQDHPNTSWVLTPE